MAFNINNFKSELVNRGYVRTNAFKVLITPPTNLVNGTISNDSGSSLSEMMPFRAEQTRTPGLTIVAVDVNRYGVGPTQKQPISAQFSDTSISMLCDKNGYIYNFWHIWANYVFSACPNVDATDSKTQINKSASYTAEYKSNYTGEISITEYTPSGDSSVIFNYHEAFPIQIRENQLDWSDESLVYLDVIIAFKDYSITKADLTTTDSTSQKNTTVSPKSTSVIGEII
jgi:hypothetical protein